MKTYIYSIEILENKNNTTPKELLIKLGLEESEDPQCANSIDLQLNNIKELTVIDARNLILAAITLYNDLSLFFIKKVPEPKTLIESIKLQKLNRRDRLDDNLKQQEFYAKMEELSDPLTKSLIL